MRRFLFATAIVAAAAIATPLAANESTAPADLPDHVKCLNAIGTLSGELLEMDLEHKEFWDKVRAQEQRIRESLSEADEARLKEIHRKKQVLKDEEMQQSIGCVYADIEERDVAPHLERIKEISEEFLALEREKRIIVGKYLQNDE